MRRGFNTLAAQAEKTLALDPYSGHLFVFRGRRGDLLKIIWWDSQGRVPVQQTPGEGPVRVACRQGRQDQRQRRTTVDAAGRDRLAHAKEDVASVERRIGQ